MFPDMPLLERTSMNSWDDKKVRDALKANGRKKVVVSGLWVEVCNNTFALSAMLEGGYEIYEERKKRRDAEAGVQTGPGKTKHRKMMA